MQRFTEFLSTYIDKDSWILQIFAVVLVALLLDYVQRRLLRRLQARANKTQNLWDDAALFAVRRPISLLIWVVGIALAAEMAGSRAPGPLLELVPALREIGLITAMTWFLIRLVKGVENNILTRNADLEEPFDTTTVDAIAKLVRISIAISAVLVAMQSLGLSISGLLAFGGVGGIAVGLAAKDLLANFFGGLTIYLDRPFAVGDWISSPDRQIEGTVEHIGWRQTRIRKFDQRPLYVPNATFSTIAVENPSRMTHRRIYETIGLRYEDARLMGSIVAGVEAMLKSHEEIDQTQTLMVNFASFAPSSMDFFIYTFTKTVNWAKFNHVKQDVLLRVEEIIREQGAEIAFPTSTLHMQVPPQFAGLHNPNNLPQE